MNRPKLLLIFTFYIINQISVFNFLYVGVTKNRSVHEAMNDIAYVKVFLRTRSGNVNITI